MNEITELLTVSQRGSIEIRRAFQAIEVLEELRLAIDALDAAIAAGSIVGSPAVATTAHADITRFQSALRTGSSRIDPAFSAEVYVLGRGVLISLGIADIEALLGAEPKP